MTTRHYVTYIIPLLQGLHPCGIFNVRFFCIGGGVACNNITPDHAGKVVFPTFK